MLEKQKVIDIIERQGIIPTQQRIELGQILFARPQHLSAEQLMSMVQAAGQSSISKATIYNTLHLFAERGLLREVIVDPDKVFYDSNLTSHGHAFNIESGEITDIDLSFDPRAIFGSLPPETEVVGIDVVVRVKPRD